jgi:hypothetical protein
MGKEVVYCTRCGTRLREEDFKEERAFEILNRYACADCKDEVIAGLSREERDRIVKPEAPVLRRPPSGLFPSRKKPSDPPVGPKAPSSGRFRRDRIGTSKRLPQVPVPPELRRSNAFLIGLAVAIGAALVLLLIFLATRRADRPGPGPTPTPGGVDAQQRAREAAAERAYEEFARQVTENPAAVEKHLTESERVRASIQGTSSESRLASLERELRGLGSAKEERIAAVRALLDDVRTISDNFRRFEKSNEIHRILFDAETKASEPVAFGRFSILLPDLADQVRQAAQRYEFAVGGRAEDEAKRVQALLEIHLQAKEYYQALDLISEFGRRFKDHPTYAEFRSRALRIREERLKVNQWIDAFNRTDLAGWTAVDPRAARSWRIEAGRLESKSSYPPADAYGDHFAFAEEFRDFELAIDFEGDRPDALVVLIRTHAGSGGIRREGIAVPAGRASGVLLISVDAGKLIGPDGERALGDSDPTEGRIVLAVRHGSKVAIRQVRVKRLR